MNKCFWLRVGRSYRRQSQNNISVYLQVWVNMEPDHGYVERTLEVLQNLLENVLYNLQREQEIVEELFLGNY